MPPVITQISWGKRIKNAFLGIVCGIILIFGAIYFIFSNEKMGIATSQSLQQTASVVIPVAATPIDSKNDGKVIAFHGQATTNENLTDKLLNFSANAIRLSRNVDMYQWQEEAKTSTEDNLGGSQTQTTTYSYVKGWFPTLIDSTRFNEPTNHTNPNTMPIASVTLQAQDVMVGDFHLPKQLIDQIDDKTTVDISKVNTEILQQRLNRPVSVIGEYVYVGNDINNPTIGDLRISATEVLPQIVSIIAQQKGNTLQAYIPAGGQPVALLMSGELSPQDMITSEQNKNNTYTWLIRLATLIALVAGFAFLLQPIVVLADIVPIFGSIVSAGIFILAFTLGASVWVVFTALAWFFVRPLMSIALLIIAFLLGIMLYKWRRRKTITSA